MHLRIAVVTLCLLISFSSFPMSKTYATEQSTWISWSEQTSVPVNKQWRIDFNTAVNPISLTEESIYIFDSKLSKVPINVTLENQNKTIVITPEKDYNHGMTYQLMISDKVRSIYGKLLKSPVKMRFKTSQKFQVSTIGEGGNYNQVQEFEYYNDAVTHVAKDGTQVIMEDGKVVWMASGIATSWTKGITILYKDANFKDNYTYVAPGTELSYIDTVNNRVLIQLGDKIAYVKPEQVQLTPTAMVVSRSYYKVENNNLVHYIYESGRYVKYTYGPAPFFLKEGAVAYSWDGKIFNEQESFPFFNQLSLRTKTSYTAEQLDSFIKKYKPESPLLGTGAAFKAAEEKYQVNALYLLAHAIHESAWGLSKIAQDKKNLFGLRATDDNPYNNAMEFASFQESINFAANYVSTKYLQEGTWYYNGDFLGNKTEGMNVRYASDPYWGQKIAGLMYRADQLLGEKDRQLLTDLAKKKGMTIDETVTVESTTTSDQSTANSTEDTATTTEQSTSDSTN